MNDRITLREQLAGMAFAAPYIIGVAAFLVFPLAMSLYYSFCNYSMLQPPIWIGWDNYRDLLTDHAFHTALWNTIFYAAVSVPFTLTLSLLLALLLNEPVRGQGLYRTIVFLPSLVPLVASALIWQWLFNADKGLINAMLRPVLHVLGQLVLSPLAGALGADHATIESLRHLSPPVWLGDPHWAMAAIIFISFWGVGQTVVIFLAGLQDVPHELYEAAEMDGAGAIHRLFHITLPMLSPVIFFNLIMGVIGSWQIFDVPYVMTGGGPGRSTLFYSMYIFEAAFNQLRMGPACAMAWIQLLIILFLTVLAFASARKWVYYA
jgi:multiple sugar transport system permease protein